MSCRLARASTPRASTSFAFGLSSDFKCSVSPGSMSFRRKLFPSETQNGFAKLFEFLMISLNFMGVLPLYKGVEIRAPLKSALIPDECSWHFPSFHQLTESTDPV